MPEIQLVCTVQDPDERERRLNEVYELLLNLARKKKAAQRDVSSVPDRVSRRANSREERS